MKNWLLLVALAISHVSCDQYDDNVVFTVSVGSSSVIWSHTNTTLSSLGCDVKGKFAFFTHGWRGAGSDWIKELNENLLKYRGGCVVYMDWGFYAKSFNYFNVRWTHWPKVSELLLKKVRQAVGEGVDPAKIFLYGHSLGARMVIDVGLKFGTNKIGMIDAADPAGPEFYLYDITNDPKNAAINVQCIHTSVVAGTMTRKCHQNFILGECGVSQPAAKTTLYICQQTDLCKYNNTNEADISHTLVNEFYNSAFTNNFVAKNTFRCLGVVDVAKLPVGYKMGYDESRTPTVRGVIPVPTSEKYPYNA